MKDWNAMAAASGIDLPPADLERIAKPLEGLEGAFRPLAKSLTMADEPATIFRLDGEAE